MSAAGILGSMCFPSMTGFCGELFARQAGQGARARDAPGLQRLAHRRLVRRAAGALHPAGDPDPVGPEAAWPTRSGASRARAATPSASPTTRRASATRACTPTTGSRSGRRRADEGCVLAIHIGSGTGMKLQDTAAPIEIMIHSTPVSLFGCASELVWSKFLRKYTGLKIALSEGGIGWIPYFLERADYVYKHHRFWTHQDFGKQLPVRRLPRAHRDVLHRRRRGHREPPPHRHRHDHVGVRLPALGHHVAAGARDALNHARRRAGRGRSARSAYENACRHFRFDPFAKRPKERCSAGALRAEARHVDLRGALEGRQAAGAPGRALRHHRPRDEAARQRVRDAVRELGARGRRARQCGRRWKRRRRGGTGTSAEGASLRASLVPGSYQIGDVQARSWIVLGRLRIAAGLEAAGRAGGAVDAGARHVQLCQRQYGFSTTRAYQSAGVRGSKSGSRHTRAELVGRRRRAACTWRDRRRRRSPASPATS